MGKFWERFLGEKKWVKTAYSKALCVLGKNGKVQNLFFSIYISIFDFYVLNFPIIPKKKNKSVKPVIARVYDKICEAIFGENWEWR